MKLGTSKPGSVAPALVAFLVLAGSAALAATQEPAPTPFSPRTPTVPHVQTGRLGHQRDDTPEEPSAPAEEPSPTVDAEGCGDAIGGGAAALDRARGLDRAIQAVLDRCGRAPATHGLLNALERLRENKAKHAEQGNQGKSDEDHGKPSGEPGNSGEEHGKSGQDHGKDADPKDEDVGGPTPPPGGANHVREDGGPPEDHGQGNR